MPLSARECFLRPRLESAQLLPKEAPDGDRVGRGPVFFFAVGVAARGVVEGFPSLRVSLVAEECASKLFCQRVPPFFCRIS